MFSKEMHMLWTSLLVGHSQPKEIKSSYQNENIDDQALSLKNIKPSTEVPFSHILAVEELSYDRTANHISHDQNPEKLEENYLELLNESSVVEDLDTPVVPSSSQNTREHSQGGAGSGDINFSMLSSKLIDDTTDTRLNYLDVAELSSKENNSSYISEEIIDDHAGVNVEFIDQANLNDFGINLETEYLPSGQDMKIISNNIQGKLEESDREKYGEIKRVSYNKGLFSGKWSDISNPLEEGEVTSLKVNLANENISVSNKFTAVRYQLDTHQGALTVQDKGSEPIPELMRSERKLRTPLSKNELDAKQSEVGASFSAGNNIRNNSKFNHEKPDYINNISLKSAGQSCYNKKQELHSSVSYSKELHAQNSLSEVRELKSKFTEKNSISSKINLISDLPDLVKINDLSSRGTEQDYAAAKLDKATVFRSLSLELKEEKLLSTSSRVINKDQNVNNAIEPKEQSQTVEKSRIVSSLGTSELQFRDLNAVTFALKDEAIDIDQSAQIDSIFSLNKTDDSLNLKRNIAYWIAMQFQGSAKVNQSYSVSNKSSFEMNISNKDLGSIRVLLTTDVNTIKCHFICVEHGTDIVLRNNIDSLIDEMHRLGYRDIRASFATGDHTNGARQGREQRHSNKIDLDQDDNHLIIKTSQTHTQISLSNNDILDLRL
jgi:hypothetical protein